MYKVLSICQTVIHLMFSTTLWGRDYFYFFYLHFTDKETETQSCYKTCSGSGGWWVTELAGEARQSGSRFCDFNTILCYFKEVQVSKNQKQTQIITFLNKKMKENSNNKGVHFFLLRTDLYCIYNKNICI